MFVELGPGAPNSRSPLRPSGPASHWRTPSPHAAANRRPSGEKAMSRTIIPAGAQAARSRRVSASHKWINAFPAARSAAATILPSGRKATASTSPQCRPLSSPRRATQSGGGHATPSRVGTCFGGGGRFTTTGTIGTGLTTFAGPSRWSGAGSASFEATGLSGVGAPRLPKGARRRGGGPPVRRRTARRRRRIVSVRRAGATPRSRPTRRQAAGRRREFEAMSIR